MYLISLLNSFLSILCCRKSDTNRPQVNQSDLEVAFKSVRTVSGYVRVATLTKEPRFTSMKFLRNLETIGGDELRNVGNLRFSLLVFSTGFYNLGLESLKSITKGDVLLSGNSKLCLNLTQEGLRDAGIITQNQSAFISSNNVSCGKLTPLVSSVSKRMVHHIGNDYCNSQCNITLGCWGQSASHCVGCVNFEYFGTCVSDCATAAKNAGVG